MGSNPIWGIMGTCRNRENEAGSNPAMANHMRVRIPLSLLYGVSPVGRGRSLENLLAVEAVRGFESLSRRLRSMLELEDRQHSECCVLMGMRGSTPSTPIVMIFVKERRKILWLKLI